MICQRCGESLGTGKVMPIPHYGNSGFEIHHYHYECYIRMLMGGLNHLKGTCTCCGGSDPPDPPELTPHQAAIAAFDYWWEQQKKRAGARGRDAPTRPFGQ